LQFIPPCDKKSSLYYRPTLQKPNGYKAIEKKPAFLAGACQRAADAAVIRCVCLSNEAMNGLQLKKGP